MNPKKALRIAIAFLSLAVIVWGQAETGQITGVVMDPSGAVIANAEVTIRNADTGTERLTTANNDGVYAVTNLLPGEYLITVTASGFGKRFSTHEFRTTSRGAQGVWAGTFSAYTGDLVGCFPVEETDGLVLVTNGGQTIRTRVKEIRVAGRTTRGVRLFDLADGQFIVDVARVAGEE